MVHFGGRRRPPPPLPPTHASSGEMNVPAVNLRLNNLAAKATGEEEKRRWGGGGSAILRGAIAVEWKGGCLQDTSRTSGGWDFKDELWEMNRKRLTDTQSRGEEPRLSSTTMYGIQPRDQYQSRPATAALPKQRPGHLQPDPTRPLSGGALQMKSQGGEPRNKEFVDYKTSIRNEMWRGPNARGVKWRGVEFSEAPKAWSRESSQSRSSEVLSHRKRV